MTVGQLKEYLEKAKLSDDTPLLVHDYDDETDTFWNRPTAYAIVWDKGQNLVIV